VPSKNGLQESLRGNREGQITRFLLEVFHLCSGSSHSTVNALCVKYVDLTPSSACSPLFSSFLLLLAGQLRSVHNAERGRHDKAAWPNGKASDYDLKYIRRSWVRAPSWSTFAFCDCCSPSICLRLRDPSGRCRATYPSSASSAPRSKLADTLLLLLLLLLLINCHFPLVQPD
jgi:hypothetical protein